MKSAKLAALLMLGSMLIVGRPAMAGSHTWKFAEVFSNADGTIQFIEFREPGADTAEFAINGHSMSSNTKVFAIGGAALTGNTAFKRFLVATPAFAALPGAPTPDRILPAGSVPFFSRVNDTLACTGWPSFIFSAGQLPTDGIHSLVCNTGTFVACNPADMVVAVNSPTNYAGATGSVDVSTPPPAVPDGSAGSTPMTVAKLNTAGTSLSVSFDTAACSGVTNRQIIYGEGSQLPTSGGGTFGLTGSACGVTTSPFVWNPAPAPSGGTGLIWWLLTVRDGSNREGSWGKKSSGAERVGPGPGGSSGQCGVTTRNIANACGH